MSSPLAVDLFCGLGGWTEGLLEEGYRVVGFDVERHAYGEHAYPAQLVLQDVLTIHGSQFKSAALIVASPPCQEYSYMAMPWSLAKQKQREYEDGTRDVKQLTALFDACFRIQREASEAAGRYIPLVVENVRGAQKWVGKAKANYGSFFLWGDVETVGGRIVCGHRIGFGAPLLKARKAVKVGGLDWKHPDDQRHRKGQAFNPAAQGKELREERAIKNTGGLWFNIGSPGQIETGRNPVHELTERGVKGSTGYERDHPQAGLKGAGDGWFNDAKRKGGASTGRLSQSGSKPLARKAASAMIAKIPLVLSRHIAASWHPGLSERSA